jgi:hypothetical protein
MTTEKTPTLPELKAQMAKALAEDNYAEMGRVAKLIKGHQDEIAKAEAEKYKAEAAKLAGIREKVAQAIHAFVMKNPAVMKGLTDTKALGFTFKRDTAEVQYASVALTVPQPPAEKAKRAGGGGTGKSKTEYGLSLNEIFEKFATEKDRNDLKVAEGDDNASGGKAWNVKNGVKKAAIAAGTLKPVAK